MNNINYIVITPVRNEFEHFPRTITSMVAQTLHPVLWVIVDDGSTDGTAELADAAAAAHRWISVFHCIDRGYRQQGTGVINAFYEGFTVASGMPWSFLSKMDGDLEFGHDYFVESLKRFRDEPKLGIGGGTIYYRKGDNLVNETPGDPVFHVRGATKIYRRACWEELSGLTRAPGWDTIDELKAQMLGWITRPFPDLPVTQLKPTGSADGSWKNSVKNGRANYITGYHPFFMAAKCAKRFVKRPYFTDAAGLAWGFYSAYRQGVAQIDDRDLIRYIRHQQLNKLLLKPSLW